MQAASTDDMKKMSRLIRGKVVELSFRARTPHLASALSCVDILTAAYWGALKIDPKNPDKADRDRCILSKGHAATAIYAALGYRGFYTLDFLDNTYNKEGSVLPEHPSPHCLPGIEMATGSLGHGLPVGLGMALAARVQERDYRVYVVMSDGECNEGSVWEAALFAGAQKLDRVTAIVDYNKWQATGRSNEVMSLNPMKDKWSAFGWSTYEVDGHDLKTLSEILSKVPDGTGKPVAVIANTVKGKGVSFMEDNNDWHYRIPSKEEFQKAMTELGLEAKVG